MKCQILFPEKIDKNKSKKLSAEIFNQHAVCQIRGSVVTMAIYGKNHFKIILSVSEKALTTSSDKCVQMRDEDFFFLFKCLNHTLVYHMTALIWRSHDHDHAALQIEG